MALFMLGMTILLEIHSNKALLTSDVRGRFNPKSKIQNPKSLSPTDTSETPKSHYVRQSQTN
jgi:hypothetical protein